MKAWELVPRPRMKLDRLRQVRDLVVKVQIYHIRSFLLCAHLKRSRFIEFEYPQALKPPLPTQ